MSDSQDKKNASLALNVAAIAVGMVCMAYAAVPLYELFCRVTGFGGTPQTAEAYPEEIIDRTITVRFNSDTDPNLPWNFQAEQVSVDVKVGEPKLVFFSATNKGNIPTEGTAIYNVTPAKAGGYFNKVQCFCFDRQELAVNEKMEFPVSFFIDPEIMNDENADDIKTITLSYTFFKVKS